jgi:hypothetical protein
MGLIRIVLVKNSAQDVCKYKQTLLWRKTLVPRPSGDGLLALPMKPSGAMEFS